MASNLGLYSARPGQKPSDETKVPMANIQPKAGIVCGESPIANDALHAV